MARPRSDDKRDAIAAAAVKVIAAQGLSAPTALIAKEAGVSNGSLFTYFATKSDLLNQLYIDLKTEMAEAAMAGLPNGDLRQQMLAIWSNWLRWTASHPDKRRALAHLSVAGDITAANRQAGHRTMTDIAELLERSRANGPMRDAPLGFVVALMSAAAEATIDFMLHDPAGAETHSRAGFDAMWRMIA
jgi:AcrR family transcriptional regulator